MTNRLHILNQYLEFKQPYGIGKIIQYIKSDHDEKLIPAEYNTEAKRKRYEQKFGLNSGFDVKRMGRETVLVYRPNNDNSVELEVVEPAQREEKMKLIYDDIDRGLGLGITQFYNQVAMNYLNISKQLTSQFLKRQANYQITRPIKKLAIDDTVITKAPNDRWAIDIIVMGKDYNKVLNNSKEYILTCVDYFSGKCWARGLSSRDNDKETDDIPKAFIEICEEAETYPKYVQCDGEFDKGAIKRWCKTKKIKMIKVASYSPTANAKIERLNREMRKKIKANFVKTNLLVWHPYLQNFCNNINNQKNSTTKLTPNQLWKEGHEEIEAVDNPLPQRLKKDDYTMAQLFDRSRKMITNKALRAIASSKPPVFRVGEFVRISMRVLFPQYRQVLKNRMGISKLAVNFTPEIYQVVKVNRDDNDLKNTTYELIRPSLDGRQGNDVHIVSVSSNPNTYFKFLGDDLQLVTFEGDKHLDTDNEENNYETRGIENITKSTLQPASRYRGQYINRITKTWKRLENPHE